MAAVQTLPLPRYLRLSAGVNGVVAVITAFVVAALATSRANGHALTPIALAGLVTGAAAVNGVVAWISGMAAGALDVVRGTAINTCRDDCPQTLRADPFVRTRMWRNALLSGLTAAAWAAAGGGLLAVALNGRRANLGVAFVALAALLAMVSASVDATARHRGTHAVSAVRVAPPVSLRRRAWRDIALPLALFQMVVNMGLAVLLFHDYSTGAGAGGTAHALTGKVALADIPVTVIVVAVIFNIVVSPWGTAEAALGRVQVDGDRTMRERAGPVGVQALVYLALAGLFLGWVAARFLPNAPSLGRVALVRSLYSGTMIFLAAGLAFVRGAINGSVSQ
jgi:hypothetical protein